MRKKRRKLRDARVVINEKDGVERRGINGVSILIFRYVFDVPDGEQDNDEEEITGEHVNQIHLLRQAKVMM